MTQLRITADSADPATLFATYQDYTARYERVCGDIDALDRRLRHVTDHTEGQRLTGEMIALTEDSAVLLGWVAAAFAAYVLTTYEDGTATAPASATTITADLRRIGARPGPERRRQARSRR